MRIEKVYSVMEDGRSKFLRALHRPSNGADRLATGLREEHHGFTLIELLTVIAIIAILAAMLMPALEAAREATP